MVAGPLSELGERRWSAAEDGEVPEGAHAGWSGRGVFVCGSACSCVDRNVALKEQWEGHT